MTLIIDAEVSEWADISCDRCGQTVKGNTRETRKRRGDDSRECTDCRRAQAFVITKDGVTCKPWHGDIDLDTMQPLKDGKPYLPGERSCGHSDCVNTDHIQAPTVPDGFKVCSVCREPQPLVAFGIDRKKRDGLNCECKPCRNSRNTKSSEKLTAEQHSLYYRTGKHLSYEQLIKKLEKERVN